MSGKRYLMLNEAIDNFFALLDSDDSDSDDLSENETDIVILPPEVGEVTDNEGDDAVISDANVLPNDVSGEVEIHSNRKDKDQNNMDSTKKKRKIEPLKWKKIDPIYTSKPKNEETSRVEKLKRELENLSSEEIFGKFFDSEVYTLLVNQTNIYAQQNNWTDFFASKTYLKRFIGFLLLTGYHTLPQEEMYWSLDKDVSVPFVRESMSRIQYRNMKQNLHMADNNNIDKNDKLYKVRPYINLLNKKFQQFGIFAHNLSIDEQMIPYRGKHSAKMFLEGKPLRFGYKAWTLASSDGFVFHFDIYTGKSKISKNCNSGNDFGLGGNVVLQLLEIIKSPSNHTVHFDNYFNSVHLMSYLQKIGFYATGTVQNNRMLDCHLESIKSMKKKERGYFDYLYEETEKVLLVRWSDNAVVTLCSNFGNIYPLNSVSRHSKGKGKILVPQPNLIQQYYDKIGGVDLCDNLVAAYRIKIRGKKWWWPIFINYIDVSMVNAWKIWSLVHPDDNKSLLTFRREVSMALMRTPSEDEDLVRTSTGRPSKLSLSLAVKNEKGHFLIRATDNKRRRCKYCHSQTIYRCNLCEVALHHECSAYFHTK